jgi:hypothetical protein
LHASKTRKKPLVAGHMADSLCWLLRDRPLPRSAPGYAHHRQMDTAGGAIIAALAALVTIVIALAVFA